MRQGKWTVTCQLQVKSLSVPTCGKGLGRDFCLLLPLTCFSVKKGVRFFLLYHTCIVTVLFFGKNIIRKSWRCKLKVWACHTFQEVFPLYRFQIFGACYRWEFAYCHSNLLCLELYKKRARQKQNISHVCLSYLSISLQLSRKFLKNDFFL